MSPSESAPYGPNTAEVRQFLVALANLEPEEHEAVCHRYTHFAGTSSWRSAEVELATALEESGRLDLRDAVAGPFMSLVRLDEPQDGDAEGDALEPAESPGGKVPPETVERGLVEISGESKLSPGEEAEEFDPIAEPALAMLLAILVKDLITPQSFRTLSASFDTVLGTATD